jgi:hypothetical protein
MVARLGNFGRQNTADDKRGVSQTFRSRAPVAASPTRSGTHTKLSATKAPRPMGEHGSQRVPGGRKGCAWHPRLGLLLGENHATISRHGVEQSVKPMPLPCGQGCRFPVGARRTFRSGEGRSPAPGASSRRRFECSRPQVSLSRRWLSRWKYRRRQQAKGNKPG